jgi:hypothetical protein
MNRLSRFLTISCIALAFVGCNARTDKKDSGGVLLSLTNFDQFPATVSASGDCCNVAIPNMTLANVAKDPGGTTSELMNVEIQSYEVSYTREDTGTRVPPKLVQFIFGVVPVNGTSTLTGYPIMRTDQFNNQPIKDMLDFGLDRETNSQVIRIRIAIRFFGHTLSGKSVESAPAYGSIEIVP